MIIRLKSAWNMTHILKNGSSSERPVLLLENKYDHCHVSHASRIALTDFRVRTDRVQGNQVHSITVRGLGIPQTDFQPISMHR